MAKQALAVDLAPERDQLLEDAIAGLSRHPKSLPCKYFYDARGSALFERICELDEYYPTRTEIEIMTRHGAEMAAAVGECALLVEYGTGSARKARVLLDHLEEPAGYVPVDISREHLVEAAQEISADHPKLPVLPVCADFTGDFELPETSRAAERVVAWFPGSTIGNFTRGAARDFLARIAALVGDGGGLLIGVDLKKDRETLERAYDDAEGVTAAFNKNLLVRLNEELGADFALDGFDHRAHYDAAEGRVEMHLVSRRRQAVELGGEHIEFDRDETIHTENSYKYALDEFDALAREAGFTTERVWTDPAGLFSVQYLRVP